MSNYSHVTLADLIKIVIELKLIISTTTEKKNFLIKKQNISPECCFVSKYNNCSIAKLYYF